jgi:isoleucyl-tRNA synthetase
MRAGLPQKEPEILAHWRKIDLYARLREAARGRTKFVLHDGPPYANGNIHIGHALNKILKDVVTRSQQMLGYDSNYVPGWDCHGLPIEWKIEEENYRAKGKTKPDLSDPAAMIAFRRECRAYAEHWLGVQREEFKRLGVEGDWAHPYTTMDYAAEAQIAREIMKFAANGALYRGSKPVMWSVVEQTALAEAEVEYEDFISDTVSVKFPLREYGASDDRATADLHGASIVIWTTTPWTLPGNRAISFSSKIKYGLYEVTDAPTQNWVKSGDKLILADTLAAEVMKQSRVTEYRRIDGVPRGAGERGLVDFRCAHPLKGLAGGYEFDVPLLKGDHVTEDTGTGFVHTAPGHGRDDFDIWMANARTLASEGINTAIPYTVDGDGFFTDQAPGFGPRDTGGKPKRVITDKGDKGDAHEAVIKALVETGMLIARGRLKHQYPHSWRSKKPVIFRNTPQWFIAMDKPIADAPPPDPPPQAGGVVADGMAPPLPLPSWERVGVRGRSTGSDSRPAPSPASTLPSPAGGEGRVETTSPTRGEVRAAANRDSATQVGAGDTLRHRALAAIRETRWVPPQGENRITGMIESKPDWVISRQRAWGVPIAVFAHETGDGSVEILKDERVNARIAEAFEREGADAWYAAGSRERFLGPLANEPWRKVDDILDVWFDSGSTHAFTLEDAKHFPGLAGIRRKIHGGSDTVMYLEGSDQHRGWFHSSLIESCGTRGVAPYDVVLTHGFVLDENGRKMSKSLGNVVAPQDVIKSSGADILRMWVCASDYADDLRIGPEILKTTVETYRKLRNTIRWMLGNLAHFRDEDRIDHAAMPGLERYILHRLAELDSGVRKSYVEFDFKRIFAAVSQFMTVELSAFYFDIRKDALYCDPISSVTRKSCLTVIDHLFRATVTWLAPMLCFTAEEAWLARYPGDARSVHLERFPEIPAAWRDEALAREWGEVRRVRKVVTGALEIARAEKRIGSSLEAAPTIHIADPDLMQTIALALDGERSKAGMAEVAITSAVTIEAGEGPPSAFRLDDVPAVAVVFHPARGTKCARSWKIEPDVGSDPDYPDVTPRDAAALREWDAAHAAPR